MQERTPRAEGPRVDASERVEVIRFMHALRLLVPNQGSHYTGDQGTLLTMKKTDQIIEEAAHLWDMSPREAVSLILQADDAGTLKALLSEWSVLKHTGALTGTRPDDPVTHEIERKPEQEYFIPLYRSTSLAALFLLWRDGELPRRHFTGAPDTDAESNALQTFWLKDKIPLGKVAEVLLETCPRRKFVDKDGNVQIIGSDSSAIIGNEGVMKYARDYGHVDYDFVHHPNMHFYEIPEVYIGQRLRAGQLKVSIFDRSDHYEPIKQLLNDHVERFFSEILNSLRMMSHQKPIHPRSWSYATETSTYVKSPKTFEELFEAVNTDGSSKPGWYIWFDKSFGRVPLVGSGSIIHFLNSILWEEFGNTLDDETEFLDLGTDIDHGFDDFLRRMIELRPGIIIKRIIEIRSFIGYLKKLPMLPEPSGMELPHASKEILDISHWHDDAADGIAKYYKRSSPVEEGEKKYKA